MFPYLPLRKSRLQAKANPSLLSSPAPTGDAVHVPVTGMYAVIVAIDWFIDRFRIAFSASGDAFAAKVIATVTGWKDGDEDGHDAFPRDVKSLDDFVDDDAASQRTVVFDQKNYWHSQESHGVSPVRSLWD